MKNKGLFYGILLVAIVGISGGIFLFKQEKKTENKLDINKYEGYTFKDMTTHEKEDAKIYTWDKAIEYATTKEVSIQLGANANVYDKDKVHTYSIMDGFVIMKKNNQESYTFKNIKNASTILKMIDPLVGEDHVIIAILTSNGEVYIRDYLEYEDLSDEDFVSYPLDEQDIIKIEGQAKIQKIGTAFSQIVAKMDDNRFYSLDLENRKWNKMTYSFQQEGIEVNEDATATSNNQVLKDENGNPLSLSGIIRSNSYCDAEESTVLTYLLTRQGYLYQMNICNSTIKKYTEKQVKKIGTKEDAQQKTILLFEDGTDLKLEHEFHNLEEFAQ